MFVNHNLRLVDDSSSIIVRDNEVRCFLATEVRPGYVHLRCNSHENADHELLRSQMLSTSINLNSPVISVSTDTSLKPTPRVVCCLTSPLLVDSQKDDVFKTLVKGKQTLVRSLSKRLRVHSSAALWLYFLLLFWPVVEHNEPGFSHCL